MKTYVKQAIIPFVYLIFATVVSIAIMSLGNEYLWLKYVLGVLNVALYLTIVCTTCFKDGQEALKVRTANDLERMQIIKTGEDRPLKLHEEYKWWKGAIIGGFICVPMLLLLIAHTILILINPSLNGCGIVVAFLYMFIFSFFIFNRTGSGVSALSPMSPESFYLVLIAIPIITLACGISYYLGAQKIERQQQAIRERHREIYGE